MWGFFSPLLRSNGGVCNAPQATTVALALMNKCLSSLPTIFATTPIAFLDFPHAPALCKIRCAWHRVRITAPACAASTSHVSIFLLHLQGCLHTAQSSEVIKNPFILFVLHLHQKIPPTLRKIMQLYWLNRSNPSNNRFITSFNKLSMTTSSARQVAHQGLDLKKDSTGT
jgi:hypothetical protein